MADLPSVRTVVSPSSALGEEQKEGMNLTGGGAGLYLSLRFTMAFHQLYFTLENHSCHVNTQQAVYAQMVSGAAVRQSSLYNS